MSSECERKLKKKTVNPPKMALKLNIIICILLGHNAVKISAQHPVYSCNDTDTVTSGTWKFHCFDKQTCLNADIQICQSHLPAKCPDKSDQSEYLCQRVSQVMFLSFLSLTPDAYQNAYE